MNITHIIARGKLILRGEVEFLNKFESVITTERQFVSLNCDREWVVNVYKSARVLFQKRGDASSGRNSCHNNTK